MQTYTIKEAAKLSWLPSSTLRYYETMWLINFIHRNTSSKHRIYRDEDIDIISAIACLNMTGMSIWDMKKYLYSNDIWIQLKLLKEQEKKINEEKKSIKFRKEYVKLKIKYWELKKLWEKKWLEELKKEIYKISKQLRFWAKK
jgi:DNA-binding transcriptional MerR regulator